MKNSSELNSWEINQLRCTLSSADDRVFDEFIQLVNKLIITQLLLMPDTSETALSPGNLRTDLKKLKGHYQRAIDGLKDLRRRGILPTIIDQHYLIANQARPQASLKRDNENYADLDSSEVEKKTKELLLAVESFESAIEVSRGRRRASENTFLIIKIAEFFEKNLPGLVISASTSTKFCKVIAFILSEVLEPRLTNSEEPTYEDPRRQIENALEVFRASK
jgi:hypothetical protein